MPVVENLEVSPAEIDRGRLLGAALQAPGSGGGSETYAVKVAGWALGRQHPVEEVQAVHDGRVLQAASVRLARPGVAARFPQGEAAHNCGFLMLVDTLGLEPRFEFRLRAVLPDKSKVPLATIRGQRRLLRTDVRPKLQPLLVTSLGRTGTTWLMRLLAEHPEIVAYRRYPYEIRTAKYWTHMLKVLAQPSNQAGPMFQPNSFHNQKSAIGPNPFYSAAFSEYPAVEAWSGRDYVERLATFCQRSIDDWYGQVAASQNQPDARYFAEKHLPDEYPPLLRELYPQGREIFLVRDFRDMASSILAFNAQRGFADFGRDRAATDEEYLGQLGRTGATNLLRSWQKRSDRAHLVRYEDLIQSPVVTLRALLEYAGLDAAPATVEGMIERASRDTAELQRHRTSESPAASIGRWRRDLAPPLQAVAREAFDDILADFGYPAEARS